MTVEFSGDLREELTLENTGLHIPATFVTSEELEKIYLDRPYGNAYDFNQVDRIEGLFANP
jgi:non-homologous end joining protein Ku